MLSFFRSEQDLFVSFCVKQNKEAREEKSLLETMEISEFGFECFIFFFRLLRKLRFLGGDSNSTSFFIFSASVAGVIRYRKCCIKRIQVSGLLRLHLNSGEARFYRVIKICCLKSNSLGRWMQLDGEVMIGSSHLGVKDVLFIDYFSSVRVSK